MTKEAYKHGDKVVATVGRDQYECHIENRFTGQSPSKKKALYVCFDSSIRFPIPLDTFLRFYGALQLIETEQQNKP